MHIGRPESVSVGGEVMWSVPVTGLIGCPDRLWFRVPEQHSHLITELADPALIGLLVPAMHAGESIAVDGPITDELAHNLRHGYQHILQQVIGGLTKVSIETPLAIAAGLPAAGVATGFSAGVDSFAVIIDHYLSEAPPSLRLTHLTYFNTGSHGRGAEGRTLFRTRFERLRPVVADLGLPFVRVDSNIDDFYSFTNFQQTNGPRAMAAASLLQSEVGRYYFASSFPYKHIAVRPNYDTAFSDPISIPLLATGQFRPQPHGDEYTRVEKTILIASAPISHASLDVCVAPLSDGRNCSQCFKCLRTELTLEMTGHLEKFAEAFDLDVYRRNRPSYRYDVATSDDVFAAEIRDFARQSGFPLPRVPKPLRPAVRTSSRAVRRVRRLGA